MFEFVSEICGSLMKKKERYRSNIYKHKRIMKDQRDK